MKEFIENLIKRLEEIKTYYAEDFSQGYSCEVGCVERYEVEKIINELTEEYKPKTQADKIRSMSDEELAEFLDNLTDNCCRCAEHQNCGNCQIGLDAKTGFCDIKKWLQSEAE